MWSGDIPREVRWYLDRGFGGRAIGTLTLAMRPFEAA